MPVNVLPLVGPERGAQPEFPLCGNKAQKNQRRSQSLCAATILVNDSNGLADRIEQHMREKPDFPNRFTENRAEVPAVA